MAFICVVCEYNNMIVINKWYLFVLVHYASGFENLNVKKKIVHGFDLIIYGSETLF